MPMNWTAEADAKLMATIMKMCDIKLTTVQREEIAKQMGSECTPKAISHRMAHFRKFGSGAMATTPAKAAKLSTSKDGKGGGKRATAGTGSADADSERDYASIAATGGDDDGDGDEDESQRKKMKVEDNSP